MNTKGDSRTAFWMNPKRDIQRPQMLAIVRRLVEQRETHASHSWWNPEAKPQSGATVRSRMTVIPLDWDESRGNPAPSANVVSFCLPVFMHLAPCGRRIDFVCSRCGLSRQCALVAVRAPSSPSLNSHSTVALSVFLPVASSLLGRLVGKMYWYQNYFFFLFPSSMFSSK